MFALDVLRIWSGDIIPHSRLPRGKAAEVVILTCSDWPIVIGNGIVTGHAVRD
jgi:hypothetical protein